MISFDDCEEMARFESERNASIKRIAMKNRRMTRLERCKRRCRIIFFATIFVEAFLLFFATLFWNTRIDEDQNSIDNNTAFVVYEEQTLNEVKEEETSPDFESEEIDDSIFENSIRLDDVTVTHYDPCVKCCGKTDGITATGVHVTPYYTVAVDPGVIPLGSDVMVDYGDGVIHYYKAEDTGGGVKGNHIDLCVTEHDEALELGVRYATVWFVPAG